MKSSLTSYLTPIIKDVRAVARMSGSPRLKRALRMLEEAREAEREMERDRLAAVQSGYVLDA